MDASSFGEAFDEGRLVQLLQVMRDRGLADPEGVREPAKLQ